MEKAIAAVFIYSLFLVVVVVSASLLVLDNLGQTNAKEIAQQVQVERVETSMSIGSVSTPTVLQCETRVEVTLSNDGKRQIGGFDEMDVLILYTTVPGDKVSERLLYTSGNIALDEWSFLSITPTTTNATLWDPDEVANLSARLSPQPGPGTTGYITVVTPNGITDSSYVDFTNAVGSDCRFLHNNPTPPTGNTSSTSSLPMDGEVPSAGTLHNYDQDRDGDDGLTLATTTLGFTETDTTKFQTWRSGVLAGDLTIAGTVLIDIYAAIKGTPQGEVGAVTVFLRDKDGASYTEIASGTVFSRDWQSGSSTFVRRMAQIKSVSYTVLAGHELEVRLVAEGISNDSMWVAYDTQNEPSLVNLSYIPPSAGTLLHLHNDPTPPTTSTNATTTLPMNSTASTSTTLYKYDADRNDDAGLTLQKTALGLSETSTSTFQVWRTAAQTSTLVITGDVRIDVWAAMRSFTTGTRGVITAYLRDVEVSTSTATTTEIANGSVFADDWSGGTADFVQRTIMIPNVSYTIPGDNLLEVRLMVEDQSADAMWLAYDTTAYDSVVKMTTAAGPTTPTDDFESGDFAGGTAWFQDWTVTADVSVITTDSPQEGTYHMKVDKLGEAKRPADLSGQSNLRWQFWAKISGQFTGGMKGYAHVSEDGTIWTEVRQWNQFSTEGLYEFVDIDLSPYTMTSQFWFRFTVDGGGGEPRILYIDDITVSG